MTFAADLQGPALTGLVELFVLDATALGGDVYRFHAGRNTLGNEVVWQGETFSAFPVQGTGFERNVKGTLPRPKMVVADVDGFIGSLVFAFDDLVGAKVVRKRTLVKYLDAVNFPGGTNPDADPAACWPDEIWFVDRKSAQTKQFIEFELAAPWDVAGVFLPRRPIIANVCVWLAIGGYRGPQCSYAGPPVAKADDTPTSDINEDRCGGRISSCKLRFGETGELPFGGFPSAGLLR